MQKQVVAAEVFSSGVCNMNCLYCYIPKSKEMHSLHKRIIEKMQTKEWLDSLEKIYGKKLEYLGLWGTEPTLTLKDVNIEGAITRFPRLRNISFSTNMMTKPAFLIGFINRIERALLVESNGRMINFSPQISLDGPAFITDINRVKGAAAKIPENFFTIIKKLNTIDFKKTKITFRVKATLSLDNIRGLNKEPNKIKEYFAYFNGIEATFKHINKNKSISFVNCCSPTLVVPGRYTSEDGKDLAIFFKELAKQESPNTYFFRLERLLKFANEIGRKPSMFSCSGGDSNLGIGIKDDIHICHRSFFFNYKEYIDSILSSHKTDNWDVSLFEQGLLDLINDKYIVDANDNEEKSRFLYVLRNYHDFWRFKISYTIAMLKELVLAGQVDKCYNNVELATIFALFINTGLSCPMENVLNTGVIHYSPVSSFRLFGNGAFRVLLEQVSTIKKGEKSDLSKGK